MDDLDRRLYSFLARAYFERPADELRATQLGMELGERINAEPFGYVLKTGHGNRFSETLEHVHPELRHLWVAVERKK